ncbi:MAG TPA: M1 family metallopeptidase, partial [Polyangiaceae bacterium]|nr:M1 family metallopeptidase [Polyangiaceae bacterium]
MKRTHALSLIVVAAAAASCLPWKRATPAPPAAVQPKASAPQPPQPLPPPREDGRLPAIATPRRYALSLRVDPAQPRFSGVSTIDVDLPASTSFVVMHGRGLTVSRALARVGGAEVGATATVRLANRGVVPDELVLSFARPLPAGPTTLEIDYDAAFSDDLAGLYRVSEGGRSYVYSQFEAVDARRAFPCFDEPGDKTPYDLKVIAPRGLTALTNTPEVSSADTPDGAVAHTFQTSPPLPTYLVAFAVGEFDLLEGQKDPFPIRVVTTKGRSDLAGMALDTATALVAKLGEYFDLRYPYAKLDLVAVPDFAAGAMENPGLITFRHGLLLLDPRRATAGARRAQAEVIAHELAHQWFGDLVTITWWDDLWLNEGFATWAEAKIVDAWKPSFGATLGQVAGTQWVMDTDALHSARAVRQTVTSTGEAMEAFDGITYDKGAAVLRMLEDWLSPEMFRRGVQHYVRENAWKNARAADLFKALEFVSTQDASRLAGDFLDHAGVPEVLLAWTCGKGNRIELRQSEWRPIGGGGEPPRTWTLPVCVTSDALKARSCFTLGSTPIVRDLGPACPTWVYPNAGQTGYYRFVVDRPSLMALARASRSFAAVDRLGLVSNAWAGVRQAAIAPSAVLDVLPMFDGEQERHVVDQVVTALRGIDETLVEDGARPAYQKYVAARLGPKKRALGWEAAATTGRESDDDDRALMRRTILSAMGEVAADPATLEEADVYAKRWLQDPASVPSDTAAVALPLASKVSGLARLAELRSAAKGAKLPEDRALALRAMGAFDDPAVLRKALEVTLTDELKLSEIGYIIGSANRRATRAVLYAWEKESWD